MKRPSNSLIECKCEFCRPRFGVALMIAVLAIGGIVGSAIGFLVTR